MFYWRKDWKSPVEQIFVRYLTLWFLPTKNPSFELNTILTIHVQCHARLRGPRTVQTELSHHNRLYDFCRHVLWIKYNTDHTCAVSGEITQNVEQTNCPGILCSISSKRRSNLTRVRECSIGEKIESCQ